MMPPLHENAVMTTVIPPDRLHPDTLNRILEDFVTRDGTDYGADELAMAEKVARLRPQVLSGEVAIVFDEATETLGLCPRNELPRHP